MNQCHAADFNPDKKDESIRKETAYMEKTWGDVINNDPYYNPNLSLSNPAFSLAFPPRIRKPWK